MQTDDAGPTVPPWRLGADDFGRPLNFRQTRDAREWLGSVGFVDRPIPVGAIGISGVAPRTAAELIRAGLADDPEIGRTSLATLSLARPVLAQARPADRDVMQEIGPSFTRDGEGFRISFPGDTSATVWISDDHWWGRRIYLSKTALNAIALLGGAAWAAGAAAGTTAAGAAIAAALGVALETIGVYIALYAVAIWANDICYGTWLILPRGGLPPICMPAGPPEK